jgi:hypothetical protein
MKEQISELLTNLRSADYGKTADADTARHFGEACQHLERALLIVDELAPSSRQKLYASLFAALQHLADAGLFNGEEEKVHMPVAGDSGRIRPSCLGADLSQILAEAISRSRSTTLTPEVITWARAQFRDEEIAAELREIRQTGGLELRDFIHELDRPAGCDE